MSNPGLNYAIAEGARGDRHLSVPMAKYIVVIDDSPTIRMIIEMALCRAGYQVMSFHDGFEVLKWFAQQGARVPDLLVVDVELPKVDGYEVIQRLRANPKLANTQCIILSQRDGVLDKVKGRLVGARAYITKPFNIQELLATVDACFTEVAVNSLGGQ